MQLLAQEWAKDAACRLSDPEPFHPGKETRRADVRAARRVCNRCPVKADCLADALGRNEEWGIWGGLDERQRRALSKPLAR